jgi:hypothetical protein
MLFVPGGASNFNTVQSSQGTTRVSGTQGTVVTPVVGSKGGWAQVIASLDHDTYGLLININSNNASAASRNTVVDIGIGAAASEVVLIPDLICGNAGVYNGQGGGSWHYFPILLPAGTRVAARAQGTVVTAFRVYIQAMQRPSNPSMVKVASFVEAIGMTVPTGTAQTPGTTNKSAWVLLGTTARDLWWWQMSAQVTSADTAHLNSAIHMDIAVGNGTDYQILMQDVPFSTGSNEAGILFLSTVGCDNPVAAGSSIYVRSQSSNTGEALFIAAYGAGG